MKKPLRLFSNQPNIPFDMAKQPYIPLYIGDWEQDTNCLTPLAEFALLKLIFKLFKAEKRGVFIANFRTLSVLFKSNLDDTKQIFQELIDNNILNITPLENDRFEIISRRMIRESTISEIRSAVGKSGGRGNIKDGVKQTKSKSKAKPKQNTDIDNEYDINNVLDYLNKKVSSNFKNSSKANQKVILARIKEGYTLDDFKKVIDTKTSQWIDDVKMSIFLRPETLFGNKFEGYLNEKHIIQNTFEFDQSKPRPVH